VAGRSVLTVTMRAVLGGLLAVAVTACSGIPFGGGRQQPPPGQHVQTPEGDLTGTAWLPDGRIYFARSAGLGQGLQLWSVRPQGGDARRLRLLALDGCRRTEYLLPHSLPDGRLGLSRLCETQDVLKDHFDLVAVDPAGGKVEQLASVGLNNPSGVTWQADLRHGFVAYFSDFCGSVAAVTRAGLQRSAGPTTLDSHTWQLDQDFFEPADADCTPRGRADLPALTADGKQLAFLASPESAGVSGWRRVEMPWNLYLQDLPDGQPRAVARGFVKPTGLAAAPDDRGVVVGGRHGGERGLWWVDLASGTVRPIAKGNLVDPSFSPDGGRLVAVLRHDADHAELRLLDNPTGGG
jgi:Tol biopolymer transport system component